MRTIILSLFCLSVLLMYSCQDDSTLKVDPMENQLSGVVNEISEQDAERILYNFLNNSDPAKLKTRSNNTFVKTVQKHYAGRMTRAGGVSPQPVAFYNFALQNNSSEGFAIVCGDKRLPQVIAYTPKGALEDVANCGNTFLANYVENLPNAVAELLANRKGLADLTNRYTAGFSHKDVPDVAHTWTTDSTIERVVYLQESVTWEQDAPYNKLLPQNPETKLPYLVGCSNIACVNIMAYYCYPETYNWAALKEFRVVIEGWQPNSVITEAAQLCKDVYEANKSQGLENGAVTYISNVAAGLQSFGYEMSPVMYYNLDSIRASLESFYPIFMRGQDPAKTNGHAFVVRGYWEVKPKAGVALDSTVSIGISWGNLGGFGDGFYLARFDDLDLTLLGLYPLIFTDEGPETSKLSYADEIRLLTRIRPKGF